MSIDEVNMIMAEACGVGIVFETWALGYFDGYRYKGEHYDFHWTIEDPRCRDVIRDHYRKKGWVITFTMHSVIYYLPATEIDHETHIFAEDDEVACITQIAERIKEKND